MPLYRVQCQQCRSADDIYRSIAQRDSDLPQCCGAQMQRVISAPHVVPDIEPYQAMGNDVATGKCPVITSRSRHREYLKRNGYVEVGNEMPKAGRKLEGDFNVRRELAAAVHEVVPRYRA